MKAYVVTDPGELQAKYGESSLYDGWFVIVAESFKHAAELIGGKLLWTKKKEGIRVGLVSIPKEKFSLPSEEDYANSPVLEEGDLVYHIPGYSHPLIISPEDKSHELSLLEMPLVQKDVRLIE